MAMKITEWTLLTEPLARPQKYRGRSVWKDALNVCCTLRGINWPWSRGILLPTETRPTHSKLAFVRSTFLRMLRDAFACDLVQLILQHMGPQSFGSLAGGTIFDARLAPAPRFAYAMFITLLAGLGIYASLNMMYHLTTVLAFALADQDPADWPPLSVAPWAATSLADFWGRRWHQSFRRSFVVLGARPAAALAGGGVGVFGAFVLSAVMHNACIWGMARGSDFVRIGGFFILNGVGLVAEGAFRRHTGRTVGGWWGWGWTALFVLSSATLVIDAWLTRGFVGSAVFPEPLRPAAAVLKVVKYLYTMQ